MRLSKRTTNIWASISLLLLLLTACTPLVTPQPTPTTEHTLSDSEVTNIHVSQIEPEKTNTNTENIELPNCGGTSELSQSLGTQVSIQKNVTVAATVITRAGVEAKIPLTARAKLEAEIELAYGQAYTTVDSRLDTIQTKAERESHVVYVIQWEEQKFVSTVSFVNNGDDYEVPYTYVLRVPKLKDSYRIPCATSTAIVTVTNTLTPTVTSTNTPTLTSTSTPRPSDTSESIPTDMATPAYTTMPNLTATAAVMETLVQEAVNATLTGIASLSTPTPTSTFTQTAINTPEPQPTDTPVPSTRIPPTVLPAAATSTPLLDATQSITPFCAFVTRIQIEELKNAPDVATAIHQAENFAGNHQNDYKQGEKIPAGVVIATNLFSSDLEQFGVIPINNQGGSGLFVTTRELEAPNAGTYWCIHE